LEKIAEKTDAGLAVTSRFISITFDDRAVETIAAADSGGSVRINASQAGTIDGRPVYDISVMNGTKRVAHFGGGHATVTIPYILQPGENPNAVIVYFLAEDGTLKTMRGRYDAGLKAVVFSTTHFSRFIIGYNPVSFADVPASAWYKEAVEFIAARGITSGVGDNRFAPENKLTRAQFVVLLMNAYQIDRQSPGESEQGENFSDAGSTYYTDYLSTARSLGIVKGTGNNMFEPERGITRQEMFVMLYNALKVIGEVPPAAVDRELSSFNDADQVASWADEALSALVKAGIVNGSNNSLNPISTTTRAEIAQVLYNLLAQ
ncbi:MAG: S-layer homology domain-containing protein, partial [Syntrophomonadaceae bacterium]|nr:S-layer homology domain-containing protein [Syntrophomonadaceae bacterium]